MSKADGGPAFPVETMQSHHQEFGEYGHQASSSTWQFGGITVRDYFAAKVLQGMYANPTLSDLPHDRLAKASMDAADAMIAARETN